MTENPVEPLRRPGISSFTVPYARITLTNMNYQLQLLHNFNIVSSENGAFEKTHTHTGDLYEARDFVMEVQSIG